MCPEWIQTSYQAEKRGAGIVQNVDFAEGNHNLGKKRRLGVFFGSRYSGCLNSLSASVLVLQKERKSGNGTSFLGK